MAWGKTKIAAATAGALAFAGIVEANCHFIRDSFAAEAAPAEKIAGFTPCTNQMIDAPETTGLWHMPVDQKTLTRVSYAYTGKPTQAEFMRGQYNVVCAVETTYTETQISNMQRDPVIAGAWTNPYNQIFK